MCDANPTVGALLTEGPYPLTCKHLRMLKSNTEIPATKEIRELIIRACLSLGGLRSCNDSGTSLDRMTHETVPTSRCLTRMRHHKDFPLPVSAARRILAAWSGFPVTTPPAAHAHIKRVTRHISCLEHPYKPGISKELEPSNKVA